MRCAPCRFKAGWGLALDLEWTPGGGEKKSFLTVRIPEFLYLLIHFCVDYPLSYVEFNVQSIPPSGSLFSPRYHRGLHPSGASPPPQHEWTRGSCSCCSIRVNPVERHFFQNDRSASVCMENFVPRNPSLHEGPTGQCLTVRARIEVPRDCHNSPQRKPCLVLQGSSNVALLGNVM